MNATALAFHYPQPVMVVGPSLYPSYVGLGIQLDNIYFGVIVNAVYALWSFT